MLPAVEKQGIWLLRKEARVECYWRWHTGTGRKFYAFTSVLLWCDLCQSVASPTFDNHNDKCSIKREFWVPQTKENTSLKSTVFSMPNVVTGIFLPEHVAHVVFLLTALSHRTVEKATTALDEVAKRAKEPGRRWILFQVKAIGKYSENWNSEILMLVAVWRWCLK